MPELPEVETIKRQLQKILVGKKIKTIEVFLPKIIKVPPANFKRATTGATIKKIDRRAKILTLQMDNGWTLLIHLKMTGQLILYKKLNIKNKISNKYTHIIFKFTDGSEMVFNDLRQFGYIKLVKTADLEEWWLAAKIGPEPLAKNFTLDIFKSILAGRPRIKIKQFLMDPQNVAGIGNIYSDEILFAAGVNPLRRAGELTPTDIKKIFQAIKKILPQAIKDKGTSANDYLDAYGQKGNFFKKLKVYGRAGQPCAKCKNPVKRVKIGGRSAHFCPSCQPLTK